MRKFARLLIGCLFLFSGFVKIIDPVGSSLVISEYLRAFGLDFLLPLSMLAGVVRDLLECMLGVMLLLDFRKQLTAWGVFLFMSFFTLLTLYLALYNPVSDCGCFGEALKLTNWQTFIKNLVFWPFTLILFLQRKRTPPVSTGWAEWPVCGLFAAAALFLSVYCYRHLPLIDFMGFRVGNSVPALLEEARTAPEFTYQTQLIYSKDGVKEIFDAENLPDSTWVFEEALTREIPTGVRHKLQDFSLTAPDGTNGTDMLFSNPQTALVLVVTSEQGLTAQTLGVFEPLVRECRDNGRPYYVWSAVSREAMAPVLEAASLEDMPVYLVDRKTALTMVRSTPGMLVVRDGTVMAKYAWRDVPSLEKWETFINEDPELATANFRIHQRLVVEIVVAGLLLAIFLLRKGFWFTRPVRHE